MNDRNAQPLKVPGGARRRPLLPRRLLVVVHVLLSLLFATAVAWQVARFLG